MHNQNGFSTFACVPNRFGPISSIAKMPHAEAKAMLHQEYKELVGSDSNPLCIILSIGVFSYPSVAVNFAIPA